MERPGTLAFPPGADSGSRDQRVPLRAVIGAKIGDHQRLGIQQGILAERGKLACQRAGIADVAEFKKKAVGQPGMKP